MEYNDVENLTPEQVMKLYSDVVEGSGDFHLATHGFTCSIYGSEIVYDSNPGYGSYSFTCSDGYSNVGWDPPPSTGGGSSGSGGNTGGYSGGYNNYYYDYYYNPRVK